MTEERDTGTLEQRTEQDRRLFGLDRVGEELPHSRAGLASLRKTPLAPIRDRQARQAYGAGVAYPRVRFRAGGPSVRAARGGPSADRDRNRRAVRPRRGHEGSIRRGPERGRQRGRKRDLEHGRQRGPERGPERRCVATMTASMCAATCASLHGGVARPAASEAKAALGTRWGALFVSGGALRRRTAGASHSLVARISGRRTRHGGSCTVRARL